MKRQHTEEEEKQKMKKYDCAGVTKGQEDIQTEMCY